MLDFYGFMRRLLIFALFALPGIGQVSSSPSAEDLIAKADKDLDLKILRGLLKLRIGAVGVGKDFPEADGRKLLFDAFTRYNVPVEWTPTEPSYGVENPTVFVSARTKRTTYSNGAAATETVVSLELFEKVALVRNGGVILTLPVWRAEEAGDFDPSADRDSASKAIKTLAEKFCLAYLSANR
jgi:hypothetical protein